VTDFSKAVKWGAKIPVRVENGKPCCPDCGEPMRDRGDGTWDCSIWGPAMDAALASVEVWWDEQQIKADQLARLTRRANEKEER